MEVEITEKTKLKVKSKHVSESTKYRHRRDYVREEFNSLHKYVTELEKRILNLELQLKGKRYSNSLGKKFNFVNKKQNEIEFKYLITVFKEYYKDFSLAFLGGKKEVIKIRRILIYICKDYFNINEAGIKELLFEHLNYTIDRSTIYHHIQVFEDRVAVSDNELYMLSEWKEILEKIKGSK